MTTVPDTTTEAGQREASVMLARLMGELSECTCGTPACTVGMRIDSGNGWFVPKVNNLYDPANMPKAWHALNWANKTKFGGETTLDQWSWWHNFVADMRLLPPAAAQRAWLDKILSLAIQAGMVQEN